MTAWEKALGRLRAIGYRVVLDGENLRYTYQGKHLPPPDQIIPLIEVLKIHKAEIINNPYSLIDQTLCEINEGWTQGALEWMKRTRPGEFKKMMALEEEINRFALNRDMNGLNEVLKGYNELMVRGRNRKLISTGMNQCRI
ncbi:MAG: hypothetical protein HXY46_03350 [Syntrophaceae bacterium]|nr:hypothetical protein [Syntrophaceae bacterium]